MSIDDWRARINELDRELLRLLNERARIALKVGESKKEAGVSLCDHTREREVVERMCQANEGPLDDRAIVELFRAIIHESRRIQNRTAEPEPPQGVHHLSSLSDKSLRVAFQGARGAFSENGGLAAIHKVLRPDARPNSHAAFRVDLGGASRLGEDL